MSQPLSNDASSPSSSSPISIYTDLIHALNPPPSCSSTTPRHLLEIEILGKSHALPPGTNVLVDGCNIAIPKAALVPAFLVAREVLFRYLPGQRNSSPAQGEGERHGEGIRNAATVMLLFDPEHVTAANARKRVLEGYLVGYLVGKLDIERQREELRRERRWVDGILTSRLHKHTKSPTLWGHRRWVVERSEAMGIKMDLLREVADVVLVAAERHFCNYYAWMHLRWLVERRRQKKKGEGRYEEGDGEMVKVLSTVKSWCLRHPSDTAGFSFLLFCLLERPGGGAEEERLLGQSKSLMELRSSICREVLERAVSFKWVNESIWVFLRTLVASGVAEDQRDAFFKSIEVLREARGGSEKGISTLEAAREWCLRYESRAIETRG